MAYAKVDNNFTTKRQIPSPAVLLMVSSESETSAYLSWMTAEDADGYVIYRSTSASEGFEEVATVEGREVDSYIDTGLETGEKYFYRICSYWIRDGERVLGDLSLTRYTDIRLEKPENVKAVSSSFNSVRIKWDEVADADGYYIYQANGKDGTFKKIKTIQNASKTEYGISDLVTGTSYGYTIEAYQNNGTEKPYLSPRSDEVRVKPMLNAVQVSSAKAVSYNKASFSWNEVTGATGYVILRATKEDGTYKEVARTDEKTFECTDKKLVTGRKYYYKVVAYRTVKKEDILGKDGKILPIQTSLDQVEMKETKNVDSTSISLEWNEVDGAQGYVIYRSDKDNTNYEKVATVKDKKISYTDEGLETGTVYYYKVAAYRGKKKTKTLTYGEKSEEVSITAILEAPTITKISTENKTDLKIEFDSVEGADGYTLEYTMKGYSGDFMEVEDTIGADATSYTHKTLASDTTYTYRLRAYSEVDGEKVYGEYSEEVSKKTEKYASVEVTQEKAMTATEQEIKIFTALCMREAGSGYKPCLAVANCVLNRVRSGSYPNTIIGVIYQRGQFQGVNNGVLNRYMNNQSKASRQAVLDALAGKNVIGSRKNFRSKSYFYSSPTLSGKKNALTIGDNTFF
jgi:fibronectin type 3 domain-containing protein